jgi:hypothetical protein
MRKIYLALFMAGALCAGAQTISRDITMADGGVTDTTHIFVEDDRCVFRTVNSEPVYWKMTLEPKSGHERIFKSSWTMEPEFEVSIKDVFKGHYFNNGGDYLTTVSDDGLDVYMMGYIRITTGGEELDSIRIKVMILPQYPKILYGSLEGTFDWDKGSYGIPADMTVYVATGRAESWDNTFTFTPPPFDWTDCWGTTRSLPNDLGGENVSKYVWHYANWGMYITGFSLNRYGAIYGDTICSTDYIADDEIKAYVQSIISGVSRPSADPRVTPTMAGGIIRFGGTVTDVAVYDMHGRAVATCKSGEEVPFDAPAGCYVVAYKENGVFIRHRLLKR